MMKKISLTVLKKNILRLFRKKKPGYTGFSSDLHIRGAATETGQYKSRLHPFIRFRQRIQSKRREYSEEYGRPVNRSKGYLKYVLLLLVLLSFPLAWLNGGGDKVRQGLQSLAFFKVNTIEIAGCAAVPKEKIVEASGIIVHKTSLLALDTSQLEKHISAVPWVARATVKRSWPAKVEILVVESAPVAILHSPSGSGGQLHYLNGDGIAFSEVRPGADVDFPVVTGLAEIGDQQVKNKALAEVLTFLDKVRSNDPHLPAQSVSELHITKAGEMVVFLVEYPFPIFFGNGNTKQKYSRLIQVLRALYKKQNSKELLSQIEYIQMDYLHDKVLVVESGSG